MKNVLKYMKDPTLISFH